MTTTAQATPTETGGGKLPLRLKILYSSGDLSTNIPQAIIMFFQLYFLTDVAGLRPDYAAWAIAAGRVWDAINDPLFGLFSDRIKSRFGRRRVLVLLGAVPLGLLFILMWLVPPLNALGMTVYYALTFICFDTAYTAVHVGFNALTPELTPDYDERSSLNGFRMVYGLGGSLGSIILATVLSGIITENRAFFATLGMSLGLFCIIPPLVVFAVTRDYRTDEETEAIPTFEAMKATVTNRPFQKVIGLYLLSWTTVSIVSAVLIYFANYYLGVPDQATYIVLTAQVAGLLFIPVSVWLARRYDKRWAFLIGMGCWAVLATLFYFLRPDQIGLVYAIAALSGLGIATSYVIPWAMIPDIIEHDEMKTGQRRGGSYYAFISFFQKLGTGLALWLMGQVLAATNYITPTTDVPLPDQPASAVSAIRLFISIVPAGLLVLSMLFAWRYPITREYHQSLRDELAGREV